ncbi:MBL fold metallo-hydrolase [Halalkalibacter urbisdiaboli]|uniref:MBL fold metallo-hydrolase n=1 Tax=Halalkalibacter urbisdiaboli TaxID=1960589 RepID=UPI000B43D8CF|nr:MBL fold metallo-hydrolase [Halalkalibacter urbisdiaboli]
MKLTKVKSVYQLSFMPRFFPVNCYLAEEEKELTLIDAALPFSVKAILQTSAMLKKQITRIVITHGHSDHVGALDKVKKAFPDALVYISKRDEKLLRGDRSIQPGEHFPIKGDLPKGITTIPDLYLNDGDRIGSLQIISTPGHTPGSMSLLDVRTKGVIVGDAFQTRGGFAISGTFKPFFPFPAWATWNKQLAIESARKILQLQPEYIACGHGKMIHQPCTLLKKLIDEVDQTA